MKNIIYRDDVVREFIKLFGCIQDISDIDEWADICQTTIREVPSAKTPNNTQTIDLINKADAIELCADAQGRASTKAELKGISKVWQELLKLPSIEVVPKHDVEIIIDEITKRTSSTKVEQGEWIYKGDYAICSKCGGSSGTQYDGVERIPRITAFCPHCGVRMTKGGDNK